MEDAEMTGETMYEITTQWGKFKLDERSYQDYLDGRSWLCAAFEPIKPKHSQQTQVEICPHNVSQRAIELREAAAKTGVGETIRRNFPDSAVKIPYRSRMSETGIYEMNLSVRASNGLMRAGVNTLGKLNDTTQTEAGIAGIRNLGAKSVKEISGAFLLFTYSQLSPAERAEYWQRMIDNDSRR